jgi:hypothetical protein
VCDLRCVGHVGHVRPEGIDSQVRPVRACVSLCEPGRTALEGVESLPRAASIPGEAATDAVAQAQAALARAQANALAARPAGAENAANASNITSKGTPNGKAPMPPPNAHGLVAAVDNQSAGFQQMQQAHVVSMTLADAIAMNSKANNRVFSNDTAHHLLGRSYESAGSSSAGGGMKILNSSWCEYEDFVFYAEK